MKKLFLFSLLLVAIFAAQSEEKQEVSKKSSESSEEERDKKDGDVKPWKKHDFKKREPEFLTGLSEEAKKSFFDIKFNQDLTKSQKTEQLKDWGEKYEVQEELQKFLDLKEADAQKKKEERKNNYEKLGDLIERADAILDDSENTWKDANEKLAALIKEENRDVAKAFGAFYPFVGDHKNGHHGHRFHHGKRFGRHPRNIGNGAAPRHHENGHGEPMRPRDDGMGANVHYNAYGEEKKRHQHKNHGF